MASGFRKDAFLIYNVAFFVSFCTSLLLGLGESPVPASNTVTSPSTFLAALRLIYQTEDIYRFQEQCQSVPSFANVLFSISFYIL
jgi:hypothetical protein